MPGTPAPSVVGLGELLWDCFAGSRRPGGAPANVAFHARQLGCRGHVCSRVGRDEPGEALCRFLAEQGLDTACVQRDENLPTGWVTVDASVPGHPRFTIHEDVAWDAVEFTRELKYLMEQANAVCFGTLAQRSEVSRETIHRALEHTRADCLVVYDANLRQQWYRREWIERSLRRADVVKLNDGEVEVLGPLLELGTTAHAAFAQAVQERYDVSLVCITRGERGCLLLGEHQVHDLPGRPVEVADAVGAGDAFTAALIFARLSGWTLETAGSFANEVGALVASRPGAMPPLANELNALKSRYATETGERPA